MENHFSLTEEDNGIMVYIIGNVINFTKEVHSIVTRKSKKCGESGGESCTCCQ